jgi:hypothetical protein
MERMGSDTEQKRIDDKRPDMELCGPGWKRTGVEHTGEKRGIRIGSVLYGRYMIRNGMDGNGIEHR